MKIEDVPMLEHLMRVAARLFDRLRGPDFSPGDPYANALEPRRGGPAGLLDAAAVEEPEPDLFVDVRSR